MDLIFIFLGKTGRKKEREGREQNKKWSHPKEQQKGNKDVKKRKNLVEGE